MFFPHESKNHEHQKRGGREKGIFFGKGLGRKRQRKDEDIFPSHWNVEGSAKRGRGRTTLRSKRNKIIPGVS